MNITPDNDIYFQWQWIKINATLVNTWVVMCLVSGISWIITKNITHKKGKLSRLQHALVIIVETIRKQIRVITDKDPFAYIPFLGTLFLYISVSNFLAFVPYYNAPTASLSTTAALATLVFFAVPYYGLKSLGVRKYMKQYFKPTPLIFPFKLISEFSRTLALAVRLFGNMMSGTLIILILLSVAPLFVPILLQILGLIIGQIQAYIFAVLAAIYIASGIRTQREKLKKNTNQGEKQNG